MRIQIGKTGMGLAGDGAGADMFPLGMRGISLTLVKPSQSVCHLKPCSRTFTLTAFKLFYDLLPTDIETCIFLDFLS